MATTTVNILGDTRREQWLTVVGMLDHTTNYKQTEICDEIRRYINHIEDYLEAIEELDLISDEVVELAKQKSRERREV